MLALRNLHKAKEAVEEGHQRLNTQEGLTVEGEDRKEEGGVGVEIECLDLVVIQDVDVEGGEMGNQSHEDGVEEERVRRRGQGAHLCRAYPESGRPVFVGR